MAQWALAVYGISLLLLCMLVASSEADHEVEFSEHSFQRGEGLVVQVDSDGLRTCRHFSGGFEFLNDAISSIKWSENVKLIVYDSYDCGGTQLVIFSGGPYDYRPIDDSTTRTVGFNGGRIDNLRNVCKVKQCQTEVESDGQSTSFFGVSSNSGTSTSQQVCYCRKVWNDDIRSYRIYHQEW